MTGEPAMATPPLRSVLFAPADHPRRAQRLGDFGADAVVLDLEDAVAVSAKLRARSDVPAHLASYRGGLRCVRVNALATGLALDDLEAVVCDALDCIIVPKVESSTELHLVDEWLVLLEDRAGLVRGSIRVLPLVESARGVAQVDEIAGAPVTRVVTLMFGTADYTADLGIDPTREGTELVYPRSRIVVACRAHGLAPPVDGPQLAIAELDALRDESVRSWNLGFQGRVVIHPDQVAVVNEAYGGQNDLEKARLIVEAFEAAESDGAAAIRVAGTFVDYPVYRRARQRLDRHGSSSVETHHQEVS